jgi:signal peptidase I
MTATVVRPARRERATTSTTADRVRSVLSMMAWLYLAVFACLAMWIGVTVVAFGWSPNLTMSESMTPSVRPGDVVLTSPVGTEPLGVGSVIVYEGENGKIIHRVTAREDGAYRTRGDANADEDPLAVQRDQIVGAGRLLIPMVGLPAYWFRSGHMVGFAGWLAITIAALVLAPNPRRHRRSAP